MREILFRGKRLDNGEWIEGYYVEPIDFLTERKVPIIIRGDCELYPRCQFCDWEEVDPDTVGEYTGLKDKNGQRIFEGDILDSFGTRDYVKYGEWNCGCCNDVYGWVTANYMRFSEDNCEVVGNIWDNKELLGGLTEKGPDR